MTENGVPNRYEFRLVYCPVINCRIRQSQAGAGSPELPVFAEDLISPSDCKRSVRVIVTDKLIP
ncbi:hypothetical protein D3C80_2038130 [compost metagenome]